MSIEFINHYQLRNKQREYPDDQNQSKIIVRILETTINVNASFDILNQIEH